MKSKTIALIIASVFLLTLAFVVVPAASAADPSSQAPTLPAQFHGTLYNNEGKPFPAGTVITAEVNGITSTFTLKEDGKIGGSGTFDEKFLISGVNDGDVVTLKIEGTDVVTTFTYDGKTAGNVEELTLVVDSAIPTPVPTPVPTPTPTPAPTSTGGSSGGTGGSGGDGGIATPVVTPTATVAETTPATAATGAEAASPASTVTTDVQPTATTAKPTEAAKTPVPLSGLMIGGMAVAAIALRRK